MGGISPALGRSRRYLRYRVDLFHVRGDLLLFLFPVRTDARDFSRDRCWGRFGVDCVLDDVGRKGRAPGTLNIEVRRTVV